MSESTLSSKGQIIIPKAIRTRLHLKAGDRLRFAIADDGTVRLSTVTRDVGALKDILPRPAKHATLKEMEVAIRRRALLRAAKS